MCLMPVRLVNPKKNLSLYGGVPYHIEVGCGKCAECQKQMQSEWYFRAYYESKWTFDNGGYVYFDTLTYAPKDLPMMSDIIPQLKGRLIDNSCFNHEHYRLFFVNLRRQLEYHGFDVKNKLKYFLTSEYGVDDRYTHRPHYHVLFYIKDDSISPLKLSEFIAKCWKYGRTDGLPYKGAKYVLDHTFGRGYNSDEVHMQTICNYVAKYVTKDNKFQKVIDSRINAVVQNFYGGVLSEYEEEKMKKLKKEMNQFHRQSHGFGEMFFMYNDMDQVYKTGMIVMPDKNSIVKHIPLPGYYSRKIFYDLVKDFEGHIRWELNETGKIFKLNRKLKSIELMERKFVDWHNNMRDKNMSLRVGYDDEGHIWTQEEVDQWYREKLEKFDSLLGDRSVQDFVIYLLCYKGRIKSPEEIEREKNGIFEIDALDEFVLREFATEQVFGYKQVYNYAHHCYKKFFGKGVVTDVDQGDLNEWREDGLNSDLSKYSIYRDNMNDAHGFKPNILWYNRNVNRYTHKNFGNIMSTDDFAKKYVITDKADKRFENFDEMYWIWCDSLRFENEQKQKFHDWKHDTRERLKKAGVLKTSI